MLLVAAGLVIALGALVQGAVGFGMNLVAAPLIAIIDPRLVPVPVLLASSAHAVLAVLRESGRAHWRGVGWATLGRVPGTVIGVLAVALLPTRPFSLLVAGVVLACVVLSLVSWTPRPTPGALIAAGVAGGTFGTAAAIGGPPVALLYQHAEGAEVRATLGAYFVLGSVLSITALALAGQVGVTQLRETLVLLPFLVVGFALSGPARRLLDRGWTRPAVLGLSSLSALALAAQALFG